MISALVRYPFSMPRATDVAVAALPSLSPVLLRAARGAAGRFHRSVLMQSPLERQPQLSGSLSTADLVIHRRYDIALSDIF